MLGGSSKTGDITHVLTGEKQFAAVVQKDRASGMDYLPARNKAPNPQDLLGSHQMEKMLRQCAVHYDLVIIDTPPVLAVSDAAMVAKIADTSVFIVRWGSTPRDVAAQAVKLLANYTNRIAGGDPDAGGSRIPRQIRLWRYGLLLQALPEYYHN
ncbi:MAG: CpsD/CapB family tyrosine-protein kinase [Alphaproteobacteria bacterium]